MYGKWFFSMWKTIRHIFFCELKLWVRIIFKSNFITMVTKRKKNLFLFAITYWHRLFISPFSRYDTTFFCAIIKLTKFPFISLDLTQKFNFFLSRRAKFSLRMVGGRWHWQFYLARKKSFCVLCPIQLKRKLCFF